MKNTPEAVVQRGNYKIVWRESGSTWDVKTTDGFEVLYSNGSLQQCADWIDRKMRKQHKPLPVLVKTGEFGPWRSTQEANPYQPATCTSIDGNEGWVTDGKHRRKIFTSSIILDTPSNRSLTDRFNALEKEKISLQTQLTELVDAMETAQESDLQELAGKE